jgi:hypothetical protein
MAKPQGRWDSSTWDNASWVGPLQGWGNDWRFWYQIGTTQSTELTSMVVEARWSTDSYTMGDGTFRGDLQPGKCAIRLWDPGYLLDKLDKRGAVWATYVPTGATWAWFYDTVDRPLVAPGDPMGADMVYSGLTWPARLTAHWSQTARPVESVTARINAMVTVMAGLTMPTMAGAVATQNQLVVANVVDTADPSGNPPGVLATLRTAAANGVLWLSYRMDGSGNGVMTVNYARWETVNTARTIGGIQIVAGPPVETSVGWLINLVGFAGTRGDTGAQTTVNTQGGLPMGAYGVNYLGAMRLNGDISTSTAPEWSGQNGTAQAIMNDRSAPLEHYLSTITVQSGKRWTHAGAPSASQWDPTAHLWSPLDQMSYLDPIDNKTHLYRVTKSDHVLNATVWQTVHTLEKFTGPAALPT